MSIFWRENGQKEHAINTDPREQTEPNRTPLDSWDQDLSNHVQHTIPCNVHFHRKNGPKMGPFHGFPDFGAMLLPFSEKSCPYGKKFADWSKFEKVAHMGNFSEKCPIWATFSLS